MWRIGRQTYMHKKIIVALQTIFIDRVSGLLAATIICIISLFFCYMAFSPNIRDQMTILFSVAFILILLSIVLLRHIRSLSWLLRPLERNIELLQKSVNFITDYKKVFVVLIMAILIQASAIYTSSAIWRRTNNNRRCIYSYVCRTCIDHTDYIGWMGNTRRHFNHGIDSFRHPRLYSNQDILDVRYSIIA